MPAITVTGADERTPIEELLRLTRLAPGVEIGLLYTETPEGRNRYPSRDWLADAVAALGRRCAVHICGRYARNTAARGLRWLQVAGRIQVNGNVCPTELGDFLRHYAVVITQHRAGPAWDLSQVNAAGHCLLVDASGGQGLLPTSWERPATEKAVGFAGGLGPENLATELPRIQAVAREPWWVDMEGRLRTDDDWFSVERAERAIETFLRVVNAQEPVAS